MPKMSNKSRSAKPLKRKAKTPRPRGRPSLYRPEYAEIARLSCLLGATNAELASKFNLLKEGTISEWIARYPDFAAAIKAGREGADQDVANAMYLKATGRWTQPAHKIVAKVEHLLNPGTGQYEAVKSEHIVPYIEHFPPDMTAAIFWLKNRQGWRDKKEVHETRDETKRVTVELSERAKQHIAELKQLLFREDEAAEGSRLQAEPGAPNGKAGNGSMH